jgi:hypothetical protein
VISASLIISFFVLEIALLARATRGGFLSKFPLFYSYIAYMLISGAIATGLYLWAPASYPSGAWFRLVFGLVVEFAVLAEVSDHIFRPYPAIHLLGRLLIVSLCIAFFSLYIFPSLAEARSSDYTILNLLKTTSLAKAAIIIALLAAARSYRLPLGLNISGMMLGFSIYLAVNVANFALAEHYGPALYGKTFSVVGPLSYTLALLVWTASLWRWEPAFPVVRQIPAGNQRDGEPLSCELGRFNTALTRILRR